MDNGLWERVWKAVQWLMAMAILVVLHWLAGKLLVFAVPARMTDALALLECVISSFFMLIYLLLGWEVLMIFVDPFLKRVQGQQVSPVASGKSGGMAEPGD